jgi:hypothetical protein
MYISLRNQASTPCPVADQAGTSAMAIGSTARDAAHIHHGVLVHIKIALIGIRKVFQVFLGFEKQARRAMTS